MRTVILGDSNPNYMYVGQTEMNDQELLNYMQHGIPIKLTNTRIFQHQIMTVMTPQGPNTMASTKVYPFPMSNSGAEIRIRATSYIDVETSHELSANLKQLMAGCLDLEQKLRVQQSGLVIAHDIPKS
jgi:hypothetical protein